MKFAKKKANKKKEDNQLNIIDVPDCSENDLISNFNQVQGYRIFFRHIKPFINVWFKAIIHLYKM